MTSGLLSASTKDAARLSELPINEKSTTECIVARKSTSARFALAKGLRNFGANSCISVTSTEVIKTQA